MNILITSVGNKINLCRYFRRALFNEGGGQLVGMDSCPIVNGREFVDVFLKAPKLSDDEFFDWLVKQVEHYSIDLIVPSRDEDIAHLASIQHRLAAESSFRVLVPGKEIVDICQDKSSFSNWCLDNGFQVPMQISILDTDLPFPLLVKPNTGSGSKGVFIVSTIGEWEELKLDLDDGYIVQEFIDAEEYTVDVFIDRSGNVRTLVPRKRVSVLHGESIRAEIDLDKLVIAECARLSEALSLVGHNTIQCFKKDERVIFCEVNLRFGGGFTLSVEAGADTPRYLIREQKGLDAISSDPDIQPALQMIRVQKDVFYTAPSRAKYPKVYCFDLDGTLCTESCKYEEAKPLMHFIRKVNQLYEAGHKIVISTARGAASGVCWRELTESQLSDWGVRYHVLHTNKPYADYYIDNKSVDVLDFI